MGPHIGSDSGAQNSIMRSGLADAADSLILDEITALRRDYSSDEVASTVSLDMEETSSPTVVLASALTTDCVFGFADPITVSEVEPDQNQDIPNSIDRLVHREKDCKLRVGAFSHPMAKFHAMDLFDIKYHVSQLCDYMKRTVPSCHALAGLLPGPGERIYPMLPRSMNGAQVSNLCQLWTVSSEFWMKKSISRSWLESVDRIILPCISFSLVTKWMFPFFRILFPGSYLRLPGGRKLE